MTSSFPPKKRPSAAGLSVEKKFATSEPVFLAPDEEAKSATALLLPGRKPGASTSERAYRRLEEAIVTMELSPGTIVNEAFLGQLSGFSRAPVRDAVRRLSFERLLVVKPKRGIYITEIDPQAQCRLLEVREEIDSLLFRSAARRATQQQRSTFARLGEDFRHSAAVLDELLFIRSDKLFNELCLVSARNEFTADSLLMIQGLSRRFWFRYFRHVDMLAASATLHANLAFAIAGGGLAQVALAAELLAASAKDFACRIAESVTVSEDGIAIPVSDAQ